MIFILLVPISLITTLLGILLAPLLPLLATDNYGWLDNQSSWGRGPRLPIWLAWFQTPDNSLDGDASFQAINPPSYLSNVKWLLRNPAYAFALRYLVPEYHTEVRGDKTIRDNDNAKAGWCLVRANGLFQFTLVHRIFSFKRCIYVNMGWNVRGLVDDNVPNKPSPWQATFVFSIRISGFR